MSPERPGRYPTAAAGPLSSKRVLVTRAARQAGSFASALAAAGAVPILAPAIEIGPPDDVHAVHRAVDELHGYAWVAFTSRNAVDAFFERLAALGADARYLGGVKIAAIGSKTAERLQDFGVRADLVPETYVNEEMARTLIERTHDRDRILIFRAQAARDVLPQMLEDAGRKADAVAAYNTRTAVDANFPEKVAAADVVTFASASSVRGYVVLLGGEEAARDASRSKTVACIGPVAAEAAVRSGFYVDVVGEPYTTEGLIRALGAHFASLE